MVQRSAFATLVLLSTFAVSGCNEGPNLVIKPEPEVVPEPDIQVTPNTLTYGLLSTGGTETQSFTVKNIGLGDLTVEDITVPVGDGAFNVTSGPLNFVLAPEEERIVDVQFSPANADQNIGRAMVLSNDPDSPEVPVDLLGFGAVPDLEITPRQTNFGSTFIPCGAEQVVTLENVGTENLVINDINYSSGGLLSADHQINLPVTLAPGETRQVVVTFEAATTGADNGVLTVSSNDPIGDETATQSGEGVYNSQTSESFEEPELPALDVLMLIDQSCSMDTNQQEVTNGMPDFFAELQGVADWQFGLVLEDDACLKGGMITPATPNPGNIVANNAFDTGLFASLSYTEELLELSQRALNNTVPGGCNEGLVRPGALLHIIYVSDEEDQSPQNWQTYMDAFIAQKGDPSLLTASIIGDLTSGNSCGANFGNSGAAGYQDAALYTGGLQLDICGQWGNDVQNLATEIVAGVRSYNLDQPAGSDSVTVYVNGVEATQYAYDPATNSVTVVEPPVGEGDTVSVDYGVLASCY